MPRDREVTGENDVASPIIYSKHEIDAVINHVACRVCEWIILKEIKSLNVISILMGARRFTERLLSRMRDINPDIDIHVIPIRVRATKNNVAEGKATVCDGALTSTSLGNRPTLIVDDLVDTGASLKLVKDMVRNLGIVDVRTAVLVNKYDKSKFVADFIGFDLGLKKTELMQRGLSDYWLFGFGMDVDESHREMDDIRWVPIRNANE